MPPKANVKKANRGQKKARRQARNVIKNELNKMKKGEMKDENIVKSLNRVQGEIKKLPRQSQRDVLNSKVFKQLADWIKHYILIDGDTPPLPSPFQEKVQVHNLEFNFQLSQDYANPRGFYAFLMQPNIEKFLRVAKPGTNPVTLKDDTETSTTDHKVDTGATPAVRLLCSDKSWTCTDETELAPILANRTTAPATAAHWSSNRKAWVTGLKIYPVGSISAGDEPLIHYKNKTSGDLTVLAVWNMYDVGQTSLGQITSAPTVVTTDDGVDIPFTPGQWASVVVPLYPVTAYISYGVILTNGADPIPEMDAGMNIVLKQGATHFSFTNALTWQDHDFFSLCAQDEESTTALRAQYRLASHIKFGLFECTVQNATAQLAKGGLIAGAQFAGGTRATSLLKDPEFLYPYLATLPHDSSGALLFETGMHFFLRPEKIQDWMFKQVTDDLVATNYLEHDVPKIVVGIQSPPQIGFTAPIINLKGWAHFEYLTQDRSSVQWKAPGDSINQTQALLAALRLIPQFTENPKHLATIGNAIKGVVTSPIFRKIVVDMGMMGLTALLL